MGFLRCVINQMTGWDVLPRPLLSARVFSLAESAVRRGEPLGEPLQPSSPLLLLPPCELPIYLMPLALWAIFSFPSSPPFPLFGPFFLFLVFGSAVMCPIYFPCQTHVVAHPSAGPLRLCMGSSSPVRAVSSRFGHFPPATFLSDVVSILGFLFLCFFFLLEFVFFSFFFFLFRFRFLLLV
jgi:hypothetical protein